MSVLVCLRCQTNLAYVYIFKSHFGMFTSHTHFLICRDEFRKFREGHQTGVQEKYNALINAQKNFDFFSEERREACRLPSPPCPSLVIKGLRTL